MIQWGFVYLFKRCIHVNYFYIIISVISHTSFSYASYYVANLAWLQKHSNYFTYLLIESSDLSTCIFKVIKFSGTVALNFSIF